MIRAWRYNKGVEDRTDVPIEGLRDAIDPHEAVVWIDCESPGPSDGEWLRDQLGIGPLVIESLTDPEQPTKLMRYGDDFHVAIHDCELSDRGLERREIDIVMGPGWLVTVRHPTPSSRPLDVELVAHRFQLQRAEHSSTEEGFLLWALFDVVIDRYFDVTDGMDDRLDTVEEVVFANTRDPDIPQDVIRLHRDLMLFRRAAAPVRDVLNALGRGEVSYVSDQALVHFRDLQDRLLRAMDLIESQRDLLTGLLEADLAVVSNNLNLVMKKMTSWGAILIVSTLVASIYGMNFTNIPLLDSPHGYLYALGLMLALTIGLYVYFKKRDWL